MTVCKIVVLISNAGTGTNLKAIAEAVKLRKIGIIKGLEGLNIPAPYPFAQFFYVCFLRH